VAIAVLPPPEQWPSNWRRGGYEMDSKPYALYRLQAIKSSVQVLRETLERRVYVDDVISQKLDDIDLEVEMFSAQIRRTKEK
jgi:hypothetical protein